MYQMNKDLNDKLVSLQIDKEAQALKETDVSIMVYEGSQALDPA